MPLRRPAALPLLLGLALAGTPAFADRLELDDGRRFEGTLLGTRAGYVAIEVVREGARAELRFPRAAVERLVFSDETERDRALHLLRQGQSGPALVALEPMARKRAALLGLLQRPDEAALAATLDALHQEGFFAEALDRSKRWLPRFQWQEHADRALEIQMLASWRLDRPADAAYFARQWIDRGRPAAASAAAWRLLARLALDDGDPERAYWIALQPAVFAANPATPQLSRCYVLAIEASRRLDRPRRGRALFLEMRQRGIAWPAEAPFPEARFWAGALAEAEPPPPRVRREPRPGSSYATPHRLLGKP